MVGSSLFSRVTRYVPADAGDPGENRITEVLAAVLERVPGLARRLAEMWLDPDQDQAPSEERAAPATEEAWRRVGALPPDVLPRVRTQVSVPNGYVDLELRFPTVSGTAVDEILLWVEIKHGIEPHDDQLQRYLDELDRFNRGAVILLDHRRRLPHKTQVPTQVPQRSWERTGHEIERFAGQKIERFEGSDAIQRWLCGQLLTYLREENLMDPKALGPEHLTALAYADQAERGLAWICERAAGRISVLFREQEPRGGGNRKAVYGEGYWASWYPTPSVAASDRWGSAWLEWHIARDGGIRTGAPLAHEVLNGSGAIQIRAGLSVERQAGFDAELQRLLEQGIDIGGEVAIFHRWRGDNERLMRVARPQDVLVGNDLTAQAEFLARWVTATLTAVETAGTAA